VSLRIVRAEDPTRSVRGGGAGRVVAAAESDGWAARLAKLIPAEALGLYGAGQAMVPAGRTDALLALAAICLLFTAALRYVATRDPATRQPQWAAVAIAVASFALWLIALRPPVGPFDLGDNYFLAALGALVWGSVVPAFYKGD
jgi:hypothetical protein